MNKIPIVMKTWAGESVHDLEYITRSIPSLLASDLPEECDLLIYDDYSQNKELIRFLQQIEQDNSNVSVIYSDINRGPNWGQEYIYQILEERYPNAPFFVNVDDDVIYHQLWLRKLFESYYTLNDLGVSGVFTALNMPFRRANGVLLIKNEKYLLKRKQPALNWLIPKDVYRAVGKFHDEGIAYDTVYSHWMRLKGFPVICMSPSYVQNIGLIGAYANDDTTTSDDFIGEGSGYSIVFYGINFLCYWLNRIPNFLRSLTDRSTVRFAPIRWGCEYVFEGTDCAGKTVALFNMQDAYKLGFTDEHLSQRAIDVQVIKSPDIYQLVNITRDKAGLVSWVESAWYFSANLREYKKLSLHKLDAYAPSIENIFIALLKALSEFHQQGVVHNKVRLDNIYISSELSTIRLAWLGLEWNSIADINLADEGSLIELFSSAVDRWARPETRKIWTLSFIESIAPELFLGEQPSFQSDIYAAAAVTYFWATRSICSFDELYKLRIDWEHHINSLNINKKTIDVMKKCLDVDSSNRYCSATEALSHISV